MTKERLSELLDYVGLTDEEMREFGIDIDELDNEDY